MIDWNRVSLLNVHKRLGWIQPNNNLVPSDRATNIMCWSGVVSISSDWNSYWISWAFLFKPQSGSAPSNLCENWIPEDYLFEFRNSFI